MRQFKRFTPVMEAENQMPDYAPAQNAVQKPKVYDVLADIDKLVKKDNLSKEYQQRSGQ